MRSTSVVLLALITCLASANSSPVPAFRVTTPPVIDGVIDLESEWKNVPAFEGLCDINTGQPCPEGGKFWLAYDKDYVYFAAKLIDSRPQEIHASEYRTNVGLSGDDSVSLSIDLSGSLAEFNTFTINPRGATNIALAGGRAVKREWSGEFLAKARITPDGWEAEAKIPWQVMRIPGKGPRDIRFNVGRNIIRLQRQFTHVYTASGNGNLTPKWLGVDLPGQKLVRSLKLLPYNYLGVDPDSRQKLIFNSGLDLKMPLTDQIELVGSINPDFRNIENQILSLDFSRFERLAGETRPFFQEGTDYLSSQIYASQRIGSFDTGINTYGKLGDNTNFGILDAVDFGHTNSLAATVTHTPDPNSSIRASFTSLEDESVKNEAYLLRYSREFGPANIFLRNMGSKDSHFGSGMYSDASIGYFKDGLQGSATYTHASPEFVPRLGFAPENDFKGVDINLNYDKPWEKGIWNDAGFNFLMTDYDHVNGDKYRREVYMGAFATMRGGFAYGASTDITRFEGEDGIINDVFISFPRGNPYRHISAQYDWGKIGDEPYRSVSVGSSYRLGDRIQLAARYQAVSFFGYTDQAVASLNYDLGQDLSLSGRVVKQGSDIGSYVALRRSGNRGAEYFLILGNPNSRSFHPSLILKVTIPFEVRL